MDKSEKNGLAKKKHAINYRTSLFADSKYYWPCFVLSHAFIVAVIRQRKHVRIIKDDNEHLESMFTQMIPNICTLITRYQSTNKTFGVRKQTNHAINSCWNEEL